MRCNICSDIGRFAKTYPYWSSWNHTTLQRQIWVQLTLPICASFYFAYEKNEQSETIHHLIWIYIDVVTLMSWSGWKARNVLLSKSYTGFQLQIMLIVMKLGGSDTLNSIAVLRLRGLLFHSSMFVSWSQDISRNIPSLATISEEIPCYHAGWCPGLFCQIPLTDVFRLFIMLARGIWISLASLP